MSAGSQKLSPPPRCDRAHNPTFFLKASVRTFIGLSQHFRRTFFGCSGDLPRTFWGLSEYILVTFWGILMLLRGFSHDFFSKTFIGLSQDFLRTFRWLSKDFPKTISRLFQEFLITIWRLFVGISEDFRKTHDFLRIFWQFFGHFSGVSDGVCNQSFRTIVMCHAFF